MIKFLVSLSLMVIICVSHAQIYKWTDSQGNVHFSDTPHEGAEIVTVPDTQSFSSPTPTDSQTPPKPESNGSEQTDQDDTVKLNHTYTSIAIAQPSAGATIRNNDGFVVVTAQVEPDLLTGDKLQLLYDGTALGEPQVNPVFEIKGMYRGKHSLAVQVIDAQGNVINTSEPITIYVFRPRVGMVPGTAVPK